MVVPLCQLLILSLGVFTMPSQKPQLKTYVNNETYEKFKLIAKKENRSASNLLEFLILEKIEMYEKNNGTINIKTVNMRDNNGIINI